MSELDATVYDGYFEPGEAGELLGKYFNLTGGFIEGTAAQLKSRNRQGELQALTNSGDGVICILNAVHEKFLARF